MKIDPHIKSNAIIFDCFNTDDAKKFIGEKGYFSALLYKFEDLTQCEYETLVKIVHEEYGGNYSDGIIKYEFFLPEKFVLSDTCEKHIP